MKKVILLLAVVIATCHVNAQVKYFRTNIDPLKSFYSSRPIAWTNAGKSSLSYHVEPKNFETLRILKDTVIIHDTTYIPVYQMYDTVKVMLLLKGKKDKPELGDGYAIVSTFKIYQPLQKTFQPYSKSSLVGVLDEKKSPIDKTKVIKIL
jgi:hypothetical protein